MSLTRDWWLPRLTVRAAMLLPASWLYGLVAFIRLQLYRFGLLPVVRLPVPVVVVGNLTIGGSGKTPLVIALVRHLAQAGYRPGVISRGYGRQYGVGKKNADVKPIRVAPDDDPQHTGDEPLLIARATGAPVFVSADRARAGLSLLAAHPDVNVVVSDDGLQHHGLAHDVGIAVFDDRGFGNGQLLPAGPLREPLSRGAGLTALVHNTCSDDAAEARLHQRFSAMHLMRLEPQRCYRLTNATQTCAAGELSSPAGLAAVAGVGNPERFFATLRRAGLRFTPLAFPDHHAFTRDDLIRIRADRIIMTEKDALKCVHFMDDRIWVLPVTAILDAAFFDLILERLRGYKVA